VELRKLDELLRDSANVDADPSNDIPHAYLAIEIAMREGDLKVIIMAVQTRAKLGGHWVDRSESTTKVVDPSMMTASQPSRDLTVVNNASMSGLKPSAMYGTFYTTRQSAAKPR
jgi:hypothetical protein